MNDITINQATTDMDFKLLTESNNSETTPYKLLNNTQEQLCPPSNQGPPAIAGSRNGMDSLKKVKL